MKNFTFTAIFLIVCLYVVFGSLYILNKDYTGEKAKVSSITSDDSDIVIVYIPKYVVRLEMPKKEWSGQDEFILQKDYELDNFSENFIGFFLILSLSLYGVVSYYFAEEIKLYE